MPYRRRASPLLIGLAVLMAGGTALAQTPAGPQFQVPVAEPETPPALKPGDAFGQEVTLPERTVIYLNGQAKWDNAFNTLVAAYKSLTAALDQRGIKLTGPPMTIYTATDDTGFKFRAALPVAAVPAGPLQSDIAVGRAARRQSARIRASRLFRRDGLDLVRRSPIILTRKSSRPRTCSSKNMLPISARPRPIIWSSISLSR